MKLVFLILFVIPFQILACTGGTSAGILSPTATFQTTNVLNGQYFTIAVSQCNTYDFTFCSNGGSASYDTQISILDNTGAQIAYNDDNCGLQSAITWTSTFTGTIRVLVSKYNCDHSLSTSATLAYKVTPKVGNYCLNGNASYQTIGGQSCIELTPEVNAQTGCAWNDQAINFNLPFNLTLNYYFGNNINGADGTTFTFQPNPSACGQSGGQLGAGNIPNSLVIEFDTYDNDNPAHVYDLLADHIAVETDGNLQGPGAPFAGPVSALPGGLNLDDGVVHVISIKWNPVTFTLTVSVDGNLRLSCSGNFVTTVFGGNSSIYWGATAATGGLNNQQYFCPNTVVVLPVTLASFDSKCNGESEFIRWKSLSEENLDHYLLEYTYDGQLFYPIKEVKAIAAADQSQNYEVEIQRNWDKPAYYRLTMVDKNMDFRQSDIIAAQNCLAGNQNLLETVSYTNNTIHVQFNESNSYFAVYNTSGQQVTPELYTDTENSSSIITTLASGIYYVKCWNLDANKLETKKFFVQ